MSLVRILAADRKSCCISARWETIHVAPIALLYSCTAAPSTIMPSDMAIIISSKLKPRWRNVDRRFISPLLPELRNKRSKNISFRNPGPGSVVLDCDVDSPQCGDHIAVDVSDGLNLNLTLIVGELKADVIAGAIDSVRPGLRHRNVLCPRDVVGGTENAIASRLVHLLETIQEDAAVRSILDRIPGKLRSVASRHDALDSFVRQLLGNHVLLRLLSGGHRQTEDACQANQADREYGHGDHHFKQRKPTLQRARARESLSAFDYCLDQAGPPPPLYSRHPRTRPVAPHT